MKLVIIGASAGGLEPIQEVLRPLPRDLDASILVLRHLQRGQPDRLTPILAEGTELQVRPAVDGAVLEGGMVYVGQADTQIGFQILPTHEGWQPGLSVVADDLEEPHAPSIDRTLLAAAPLFRNLLVTVILSGRLHDGTIGALEAAHWKGVTVAQEPVDADHASMPLSVITHDHPRHVESAAGIPDLLLDMCGRR